MSPAQTRKALLGVAAKLVRGCCAATTTTTIAATTTTTIATATTGRALSVVLCLVVHRTQHHRGGTIVFGLVSRWLLRRRRRQRRGRRLDERSASINHTLSWRPHSRRRRSTDNSRRQAQRLMLKTNTGPTEVQKMVKLTRLLDMYGHTHQKQVRAACVRDELV